MSILSLVFLGIFVIFVGIAEEVFLRGIVLNNLKELGFIYGIPGSASMFSILHLANLLGKTYSLEYVILQIIFAFIFGVVAASVVILKGSLSQVIVWHIIHNFLSFLAGVEINQKTVIISIIQGIILALYGLYLLKIVKEKSRSSTSSQTLL